MDETRRLDGQEIFPGFLHDKVRGKTESVGNHLTLSSMLAKMTVFAPAVTVAIRAALIKDNLRSNLYLPHPFGHL